MDHSLLTLEERIEMRERHRQRVIETKKAAYDRALQKVEEREHLRMELRAREYIHTCHGIIETLVSGYEIVDVGGNRQRMPLGRARVGALKSAGEMSLKLLDRVLPPLKATEVGDSPEKQVDPRELDTQDLLRMILKERGRLPKTIEGEKIEPQEDKPPWEC